MYSQPILAAKSAAFSWSARSLLLAELDHHDHSERPGRIQEVSATFDGVARSVTSSLATTVPRLPTTIMRHGVVSVPLPVSCASGRVSRKWWVLASAVTREAPYPPLTSDSVSSSHASATLNSAGYPYPADLAAPTVVCTGMDS